MEFYIINLTVLVLCWQCQYVLARHHHGSDHHQNPSYPGYPDSEDYFDDHQDDHEDNGDYCMYFRIDHDTRQTDTMFCPFGCCGNLDDQKCCDDPDTDSAEDDKRHSHIVHGLLIFAAVMLVIALTCCVFGVYKHKKAKLRKTSPGRHIRTIAPVARPSPYGIFYTARSGGGSNPYNKHPINLPKYNDHIDEVKPERVNSPPPRYTENADPDRDLPPYSSPPPPYSFNIRPTPPVSTNLRGHD